MSPTRVTVIDYDRDLLDLYREILVEFGCEVETYAGALPGIEKLTDSRPDLVIVDLELEPVREELTGLQVIHSARSGSALRDVPIVVCSTATDRLSTIWPEVMQRGDIHRLEKPFDLDTFRRVIETALGRRHGEADAPGARRILALDGEKRKGG